jgi:hypothetical protein
MDFDDRAPENGQLAGESEQTEFILYQGTFEGLKVQPLIDTGYPLTEVAEAIRYLEEGHAQGKDVTTVAITTNTGVRS